MRSKQVEGARSAFTANSLESATEALDAFASGAFSAGNPAGLTHRIVDPEAREASGVTAGLIRLSVGLEHPDDLWNDLQQALDKCRIKQNSLAEMAYP